MVGWSDGLAILHGVGPSARWPNRRKSSAHWHVSRAGSGWRVRGSATGVGSHRLPDVPLRLGLGRRQRRDSWREWFVLAPVMAHPMVGHDTGRGTSRGHQGPPRRRRGTVRDLPGRRDDPNDGPDPAGWVPAPPSSDSTSSPRACSPFATPASTGQSTVGPSPMGSPASCWRCVGPRSAWRSPGGRHGGWPRSCSSPRWSPSSSSSARSVTRTGATPANSRRGRSIPTMTCCSRSHRCGGTCLARGARRARGLDRARPR